MVESGAKGIGGDIYISTNLWSKVGRILTTRRTRDVLSGELKKVH